MSLDPGQVKTSLYEQFALIGKALSSSRRLELLDLLCQADRTVEILARESSQNIANTSQHLRVLRQAGLVSVRREGNFVVYSIASEDIGRLWKSVQIVGEKQLAEIETTVSKYFNKKDELEIIDHDEIMQRAKRGEILLLDVRPEQEYDQSLSKIFIRSSYLNVDVTL